MTLPTRTDDEDTGQRLVLFDSYTQMNSFPPVSRLPIEILETIFISCARDFYYDSYGYHTPTAPSWVNVSYVCRHWRNVALNYPTLWSYVFTTSHRWTDELLARSKRVLLKIQVRLGFEEYQEELLEALYLVEQVMDQAERIQEFYLSIPYTYNAYQFFSRLSSPAPCLQNLKISVEHTSPEWSSVLFSGDTPAIRSLELYDCPVPWRSFNLSGLTTLVLNTVPDCFQLTTIVDFLPVLKCMQNLTHLCLEDALASASKSDFHPGSASDTSQEVILPHLSHLEMIQPLSTIIAFLSCVYFPFEAKVELVSQAEPDSSLSDFIRLSSLLERRLGASDDLAFSIPTIHFLSAAAWADSFLFYASKRPCSSSSIPLKKQSYNTLLKLELDCDPITSDDMDRVIGQLCCSISPTNVQAIHFIEPSRSQDLWRRILGHLQHLRYIKMSEASMPDIASMLSCTPRDHTENQIADSDQGLDQVLAPALEELELDDIGLWAEPGTDNDSDEPTGDLRSLCDALSTRPTPRG